MLPPHAYRREAAVYRELALSAVSAGRRPNAAMSAMRYYSNDLKRTSGFGGINRQSCLFAETDAAGSISGKAHASIEAWALRWAEVDPLRGNLGVQSKILHASFFPQRTARFPSRIIRRGTSGYIAPMATAATTIPAAIPDMNVTVFIKITPFRPVLSLVYPFGRTGIFG